MNDEERQWTKTDLETPPVQKVPINFLQEHREKQARHARRKRRFFIGCLAFFFLLSAGCLTVFIVSGAPSNNAAEYDPVTLEPKKPEGIFRRLTHLVFQKEVVLEGEKDDRINVLLLGMGGIGHDGPFLTDTMIIASFKPSTNQIAMISIPRDLGVEIPGQGWYKVNHANAFGEAKRSTWGAALATETIEENFDIDIHYYIRLDFAAFSEIIDEVGGIKVNVERGFVDAEYPAPKSATQTVQFVKGVQTMDGERALVYARSRHGNNGEGGDFARARRQQKVLLALKEKLTSFSTLTNPVRMKHIIDSLDQHITTNLPFSDMLELIKMGREYNTDQIINVVFDSSVNGYLVNGSHPVAGFILAPKTGNFDDMKAAIDQVFEKETAVTDDTPQQDAPAYAAMNIEIQNGTWRAGLAARVKKRLTDKQFTVETLGNTMERPMAKSAIYIVAKNAEQEVVNTLQETLGLPVETVLPDTLRPADNTDILIILGEDTKEE